jgi:hypothetical protein
MHGVIMEAAGNVNIVAMTVVCVMLDRMLLLIVLFQVIILQQGFILALYVHLDNTYHLLVSIHLIIVALDHILTHTEPQFVLCVTLERFKIPMGNLFAPVVQ